jgi:exosome complex component RRP43
VLYGSKPFRREDLCIERGRSAWKLCIDVLCLSYEGNVTDAALIAVMACLLRVQLPETVTAEDGEVLIAEGMSFVLALLNDGWPMPTF